MTKNFWEPTISYICIVDYSEIKSTSGSYFDGNECVYMSGEICQNECVKYKNSECVDRLNIDCIVVEGLRKYNKNGMEIESISRRLLF
jgi:hypothetical protein